MSRLTRETQRSTMLVRLVQRLFNALEETTFARNPFTWANREWSDFVHRGIPPDEREALKAALAARGRELPELPRCGYGKRMAFLHIQGWARSPKSLVPSFLAKKT